MPPTVPAHEHSEQSRTQSVLNGTPGVEARQSTGFAAPEREQGEQMNPSFFRFAPVAGTAQSV